MTQWQQEVDTWLLHPLSAMYQFTVNMSNIWLANYEPQLSQMQVTCLKLTTVLSLNKRNHEIITVRAIFHISSLILKTAANFCKQTTPCWLPVLFMNIPSEPCQMNKRRNKWMTRPCFVCKGTHTGIVEMREERVCYRKQKKRKRTYTHILIGLNSCFIFCKHLGHNSFPVLLPP